MTQLSQMIPALVALVETTLNIDTLAGMNVNEVLAQEVKPADKAVVEKAQKALAALPLINDLLFEELYQRASSLA